MAATDRVLKAIQAIVGAKHLLTDEDARVRYGQDWTRFFIPAPLAVAMPADTAQVQALVKLARNEGLALVPSGGRTGLSGGAVAQGGELLVSFDRMDAIKSFNPVDRTVVAEAGVITRNLQAFAEGKGLFYPVDFASSGSSQLGGNIATNAGGIKVLRYGLTRDWVAGLKVVTGAGELLDLNGALVKNATGYDLRHIFIGSEGTLGFVTEATLRLTQPPKGLTAALLAVPQMTDVTSVLLAFRAGLVLSAFEFFSGKALGHVLAGSDLPEPFAARSDYYVLLEFEAPDCLSQKAGIQEAAEAAFAECLAEGWVTDGLLSQSEQQRANFWQYRERISEAITAYTPYKNDVAVVPSAVPGFLQAVDKVVTQAYPDFELVWFGHIGDGNLHLNILKPAALDASQFKQQCEAVSEKVMQVVKVFGGSISAEHGVGLLKKHQLHFTRSAAEIALMRSLKQVFDPDNIMNPGKLLP